MRMKFIGIVAVMSAAVALHAEFKAGFARVDDTPPLGIPVLGSFNARFAKEILDPLYINCVAVSDGENTALIYALDIIHFSNSVTSNAFDAITKATGVPRERIFLHSTHTHMSPPDKLHRYYRKNLHSMIQATVDMRQLRIVDAGKMAIADLAPAKIGIAKTECKDISFIRRYRLKDGSVRTNPGIRNPQIKEPIGTPDESVQLVRFIRTGAPDIAIVNFGTHPDTIGRELISADWPGVMRDTFETAIGGGVKSMLINGAQGDVNHINVHPSAGRAKLERMKIHKHMGRALAGAVLSVWDVCEEVPAGKINGIVNYTTVPANNPTKQELEWLKMYDEGRVKEIPLKGGELKALTYGGSRVRTLRNGPYSFKVLVTSLAIGDSVAFSGLPCEPFVDIGRDIKNRSPFRMTVFGCLTNGYEGYVSSTKAHSEGGYECRISRFGAPTGDLLVATQVSQLNQLKKSAVKQAGK